MCICVPTNLHTVFLHHHYHCGLHHVCIFCDVQRKTIRARDLAKEKLNGFKTRTLG